MKKLLLILVVFMSGCYSSLDTAKAKYLCRNNGGLYELEILGSKRILCNDGTEFSSEKLRSTIIEDDEYLPK